MYVPLWAVATLVYVALLGFCIWGTGRAEEYGINLIGCFGAFLATIGYLGFWVAYLALTR